MNYLSHKAGALSDSSGISILPSYGCTSLCSTNSVLRQFWFPTLRHIFFFWMILILTGVRWNLIMVFNYISLWSVILSIFSIFSNFMTGNSEAMKSVWSLSYLIFRTRLRRVPLKQVPSFKGKKENTKCLQTTMHLPGTKCNNRNCWNSW